MFPRHLRGALADWFEYGLVTWARTARSRLLTQTGKGVKEGRFLAVRERARRAGPFRRSMRSEGSGESA